MRNKFILKPLKRNVTDLTIQKLENFHFRISAVIRILQNFISAQLDACNSARPTL